MKKKIIIGVFLLVIFIISFIIPVNTSKVWVNDDEIADVGHYETHHYNIYGVTIKITNDD